MLSVRHLTLKLRSQSLNEESNNFNSTDKPELDRDSGTESDDELGPSDYHQTTASSIGYNMEREDLENSSGPQRRGFSSIRERTRSESGKENSIRSLVPRQRRSERALLRERCTEAVMATTLAAVAALSAGDDAPSSMDRRSTDSPVEFCVTDSALPSDSDHGPWGDQHSSEEELECINGAEEESTTHDLLTTPQATSGTALRFGPSAFGPPRFCPNQHNQQHPARPGKVASLQGPEKRKWGQVNHRRTPNGSVSDRMKTRPRSAVLLHHTTGSEVIGCLEPERSISSVTFDCSASSDDEVQSLVGAQDSPLPLEFRTSPPEGAHRPTRSLSPPPKFFLADCRQDLAAPSAAAAMSTPAQHAEPPAALSVANGNNIASPRKRHRHAHRSHHQIQRPCLDFEKMQQMKNRSVSTWRHDGELSLFCW
ncbi:uncharacterized protein LOC116928548 [Daphnia magna]|uniref:Uncharacterized protein n=1 Tax=Daphnia magna TaxID=35525 RepID=A0ABR0B3K7_9CRUS|nr:uncharacterized protein LOC116928548 [Daphnia magna]KAK4036277.1 hypothetical protein OUZ56_028339 [Daphnia magna]